MARVQELNRDVRRPVGILSGSLIACRDDIPIPEQGRRSPGPLSEIGVAVVVDAWDPSWPQRQCPSLDGRSRIVVLARYLSTGAGIDAGQLTVWSSLYPDAEASTATSPLDFVPTEAERRRLQDARGAFLTLEDRRGNRSEAGLTSSAKTTRADAAAREYRDRRTGQAHHERWACPPVVDGYGAPHHGCDVDHRCPDSPAVSLSCRTRRDGGCMAPLPR
jgi:hypothetical protein